MDSDWLEKILSKLSNEVEWCISPVGAVPVDREREWKAEDVAKQQIISYISKNYVRKEAGIYWANQALNNSVTKKECEKRVLEAKIDTYDTLIGWCNREGKAQFDVEGLKTIRNDLRRNLKELMD